MQPPLFAFKGFSRLDAAAAAEQRKKQDAYQNPNTSQDYHETTQVELVVKQRQKWIWSDKDRGNDG